MKSTLLYSEYEQSALHTVTSMLSTTIPSMFKIHQRGLKFTRKLQTGWKHHSEYTVPQ